jgi:DNA-damage-inducible protein D
MERKPVAASKLAEIAFGEALERLGEEGAIARSNEAPLKDGAIERLIAQFEDAANFDENGIEFWYARDLQNLLGYANWQNFVEVIQRAMESCINSGQPLQNHFTEVSKMVSLGSGAEREIIDMKLTRYACYLTAQNGDARKKPISFAQTYFAIQTRRQEVQDDDLAQYTPLSEDEKRLLLRNEIKEHNIKLASAAKGAGVIEPIDFAIFQNFGYKGLYGGLDRVGIQRAKRLRSKQNILDHMGSTELAANLFRATQTEDKLRREQIQGKHFANIAHYEVGQKVRRAIADIGGAMPETLPAAEDIVKVGRRLKKALTTGSKRLKT